MRRNALQERSDGELITASRTGDADAYAQLWRRHHDAARAAARALSRSRSDADDIVSEAFARVLRVLHNGGGPDLAFRPYLLTAVRNVFYDRARRAREDATDEIGETINVTLLEAMNLQEDREFVGRAFASLPERWQLVLWHTEVEGRTPAEVAPLLGLAPNAVAALAYRAREGLRQAFLQEHLQLPRPPACEEVIVQLGAYVRDGLSNRARAAVDAHLATCDTCPPLLAELAAENATLRAALIPAIVGVPALAYLSGLHGGGVVALFLRAPKRTQVAALGAAAVLAIAAGSAAAGAGGNDGLVLSKSMSAQLASRLPSAPFDSSRPPATLPVSVPSTRPTAATVPAVDSSLPTVSDPVAAAPTSRPVVTTRTTTRATTATTRPPTPTARPTTTAASTAATTVATTATTTAATSTTASPTTTSTAPAYSFAVSYDVAVHIGDAQATSGWRMLADPTAGATLPRYAIVTMSLTNTSAVAADNVSVRIFVQAPATWVAANPTGWACTVAGDVVTCTSTAPVAAGAASMLQLTFGSVPAAGWTLTPTVQSPAGATVTGQTSVVIPATSATDALAAYVLRGSATVVTSSSPELQFSGSIQGAYLVWWSTEGPPATAPTVRLTVGPDARDVTADMVRVASGIGYAAYADVGKLIAAPGNVTLAAEPAVAGWSLVVVTADPALPRRVVLIDAPSHVVPNNSDQTKNDYEAMVVSKAPDLPYHGSFPAGSLSLVALGNTDALEQITLGAAAPIADPFAGDPGVYTPAAYDGSAVTVSTEGESFILALAVSASNAPQ